MDDQVLGVLLISDDAHNALVVRKMLGESAASDETQFVVRWVENLWDALEHLADGRVDVLLADVSSDRTDDLDVIQALKHVVPGVPIVVLVAADSAKSRPATVQNNVQDCLPKHQLSRPLLRRSLQYAIDRQRLQAEIVEVASRDALTGMPNRSSFLRHVTRALARTKRDAGSSFGLMFLDVDQFQKVNDSLGHESGDVLLLEFSRRLQRCVRDGDIVARFGSDEFAVLVHDIRDAAKAVEVADRIREELRAPVVAGTHQIVTTASIGICLSESGYNDANGMLRDADMAMHQAKANGRAHHQVFDQTMRDLAMARLNLEKDLRWAVEHEVFRLVYQPIVRLDRRQISGFEALLRWEHPERGAVSPAEFIPLAEETGLIIPIGRWVIREACRQLREWQRQFPSGPPLTLNVNLSSKELSQPDLLDYVDHVVSECGIDPRCLELEITEGVIIENDDLAAAIFSNLAARGIRLSVDDFGMGYSSLSYLHRFAFDTLKIDRSFVWRLGDEREDSDAFVRTIVALGKGLDMEVIAEGVETEPQLERLAQLQCEYGQGYLFSRPVETGMVHSLLAGERMPARNTSDERTLEPVSVGPSAV